MTMRGNLIETGEPSADTKAFRRCLGQFATGVTVITASADGCRAGMSVNSFAALSMEPPLVLWSIRKESASLRVYQRATHYAVNVLAASQVAISARFAQPSDDKFAAGDWEMGLGGAPLIHGCIAYLECRLDQVLEGGDHFILIGRVERYTRRQGEPLLFAQGRYALAQDFPEATPALNDAAAFVAARPFSAETASLMRLANYAARNLTMQFESFRENLAISTVQVRLLGWLRIQARPLDQLLALTYIGRQEAFDALQEMMQNRLITLQNGSYELTGSGRHLVEKIANAVSEFERHLLAKTSADEVKRIRSTLLALADLSIAK